MAGRAPRIMDCPPYKARIAVYGTTRALFLNWDISKMIKKYPRIPGRGGVWEYLVIDDLGKPRRICADLFLSRKECPAGLLNPRLGSAPNLSSCSTQIQQC